MTRKDYVAIATKLQELGDSVTSKQSTTVMVRVWENCVKAIADYMQSDNPRFDRQRFYKACGLVE